jgi:hypothetical protein
MQPVQPERTVLGTLGDIGVTAGRAAIGLPEAFQGVADIVTGGRVGKFTEDYLDYKPGEAKHELSKMYSPAQKFAQKQVAEAKGFIPTVAASVSNPSTIATSVAESLPLMLGGTAVGGAIGKSLGTLPKVAPYVSKLAPYFGALGEGAMAAGSAAEDFRQQSPDRHLGMKQTAAAVGTGIGTTIFGVIGNRVSQALGVADPDTLFMGLAKKTGSKETQESVASKLLKAGFSEGVLEEMPQSAQEQVWANAALDRPLMEGVEEAMGVGLVTGSTMGSGASIYSGGGAVDDSTGGQDQQITPAQPDGAGGEQVQQQAPPQPGVDQDLFDQTRHFLDTNQISPDTEQGARIKAHLSEMAAKPEMAEAVAENRDIFEAMGVVEPITVDEQLEQGAVDAQEELTPGQAAQEETQGREEVFTKGHESATESLPGSALEQDVALARAQALPADTRTEEESALVKQEEERVAADSLSLRRAQAIPEKYRTDEEREVVRIEDERVRAEEVVSGKKIRQDAEDISQEHPAHSGMTKAIQEGGINIDLAKKAGWDIDSLKDVRRPGLFSKKATMGPDEMAQVLGYKTEESMKNEWVKAPTKKELKVRAEEEFTGQDQAIGESVKSLEAEGFDLGSEESVNVGDLTPGDSVVVTDKRGVPDKLTHKGFDADGNALLQDGVTIKADPFEKLKILARKTGDKKTSDQVQERFNEILETTDPAEIDAFASALPGEIEADPKLKPYKELIEGALNRRSKALSEARTQEGPAQGAEIGKATQSQAAKPSKTGAEPPVREFATESGVVSREAESVKGGAVGDTVEFTKESGTLGVPRDEMPQISSGQRGALANNLRSKGIEYQKTEKAPADLKPSQKEFLPEKVQAAREYDGTERAILVSKDGHVIDGHHQWMSKLEDSPNDPIPVIELGGNAAEVLEAVKAFPSSTTAKDQPSAKAEKVPKAKAAKRTRELLEPITEKEGSPQLGTEKRTRYLGEQEDAGAATESKRRQIGEAKAFQEARRDPKKHTQLTTQRDYKDKLPRNTERLMNVAADRQRAFNDAQASVTESLEHLEKLFAKAGTDKITVTVDGRDLTVRKPKRGKEKTIFNRAGRDALAVLKQKYKDAGLLEYGRYDEKGNFIPGDFGKKGSLTIQPAVSGKSSAAAYGPKSLKAAAVEHVKLQQQIAEARFKKDAAHKKIKETVVSKLEDYGFDHAWTNAKKDAVFFITRPAGKPKFSSEEAEAQYSSEKEKTEGAPEHIKKKIRKLGTAGAGATEAKALGLKQGEKEERAAAAEAELDQIMKSIAGTPLPKGKRADIMGELTKSLGRGVRGCFA